MTQVIALLVAADPFLNPEHIGDAKKIVPQAMTFIGSNLGMTQKDLHTLSSKLASQIGEVTGTSEMGGSRKRASNSSGKPPLPDPVGPSQEKKPRRKAAAEPKASRKRKGADA